MFPGNGSTRVQSLEEELRSEGLKPDKVLEEIERNIGLMEHGSMPVNLSGLPNGAEVDRTIADRGRSMVEGADKPDRKPVTESIVDKALEEMTEEEVAAFMASATPKEIVEKAARMVKHTSTRSERRREHRGPEYRAQLRLQKRAKRRGKAKRNRMTRLKIKRAGGYSAVAKKRAKAGPNRMLRFDTDILSNLREELEVGGVASTEMNPYEAAVVQAGALCIELGDIFEAIGDSDANAALNRVADVAFNLSEDMERLTEDEDCPEELESKLQTVLEATGKAIAAWEKLGQPSIWEAMERAEGKGKDDDDDDEDDEDDD